MKGIFEKSLIADVDISAGTILTPDLVGIKKPGTGISAARLNEFLGKTLKQDVKAGKVLLETDFL
jgi:N-acetylneuraminate synthase